MVGCREDYLGNILLYDYILTNRNPVFLNRNLTKALQIHQHILEHGTLDQMPEVNQDSRSRSRWKPPSWDTLDAMVENERTKGTFILDFLGIKPINTDTDIWTKPTRKRRPLFRLKARIHVTIWNTATNKVCKRKTDPNAELRGNQDENGIKISMTTRRITVTPDELASDDNTSWKLNIAEAYNMLIAINFTEEEATDFYSWVAPHVLSFENVPCRLSMSYSNILDCPDGPEVFPLRIGNQVCDFGLEASMYWTNSCRDGSFLAAHNRDLFKQAYPTPPPPEPSPSRPAVALTFEYTNETITRSSLVCPHEQCRRRTLKHIAELRMHLDSWHDNFKYRCINKGMQAGVQHWRFECDIADHKADQRANDEACELLDVLVIPPGNVSFNQSKYLDEGSEDFQRACMLEKLVRQTQTQPSEATLPLTIRRKNPDEVQPRPNPQPKKYRVPKAPLGVTFFRAISKRPLQEGEYISESDDEVDTTWVELRKIKEIERDKSYSEPVKRFLKRYDLFIQHERLRDDIHAGDAMVRFVRENGLWIWQQQLYNEFKTKADELLEDDIISKEIHTGCLHIVDKQKPIRLGQSPQSKTPQSLVTRARAKPEKGKEKGKGKARVTDTGHITPQTVDSDGDMGMDNAVISSTRQLKDKDFIPPFGQCLCGKDALASSTDPSAFIACENIDCIRSNFHVECIVQHWQPAQVPDPSSGVWICNDCSAEAGNSIAA